MAAKSRIRWSRILVWYLVLSALLLAGAPLLYRADAWLYNHAAPYVGLAQAQQPVHLLYPGDKQPVSAPVPVKKRWVECPTVGMIDLRPEQVKESFASVEWSAQDFAALLKKVSETGVRNLAVSAPFIWEGGTRAAGQMLLCATLQNKQLFDKVVLGMRGRTTAQADLTPIQFRSYVIPSAQVKGDTSQLPIANRQIENDLDTADAATELIWSPDWIEDEELTQVPAALAERSFPLLVRWNGEILPTLPLRLALEARRCPPERVHVELGKEIRIGSLVMPIDTHGRVILKNVSVQPMNLKAVIDGKEELKGTASPFAAAILMQPLTEKEPAARLNLMAATVSQLCAQGRSKNVMQPGTPLPALWYQPLISGLTWRIIAVLVGLFIAVRFIPSMPVMMRLLVMVSWLGYLLYLAYSHMLSSQWFHIGLMLTVWLLLLLALPWLKPEKKRSMFSRR